ncbi:MAG TPA: DinB family protein [Gemmatimonadales bacterium]|nr:DinB family protein [Gemmatimonadales bacterium]
MRSPPLAADLAAIYDRDLRALRRELEAYPEERQIWQEVPGLPNSAGTLALHLAGNLQHYIGAKVGGTDYVRNREAEFGRRGIPRVELLAEIERAREAVASGLARVQQSTLEAEFPEVVVQSRIRAGEYLIHLATHLAYHLGQVDCHRRVVTGQAGGVGALRPTELGSAKVVTD